MGSDGDGSRGASRAVFVAPSTTGGYAVSGQIFGIPGSQEEAPLNVVAAGVLHPDDLVDTGAASGPAMAIAATAVAVGLSLLGAARFRRRPTVT